MQTRFVVAPSPPPRRLLAPGAAKTASVLPQFFPRKLAEIVGLAPGQGENWALVRFTGCPAPEFVPLKVMHECYLSELIAFYEKHVVLEVPGQERPIARQ
jgi:hypothetical protein